MDGPVKKQRPGFLRPKALEKGSRDDDGKRLQPHGDAVALFFAFFFAFIFVFAAIAAAAATGQNGAKSKDGGESEGKDEFDHSASEGAEERGGVNRIREIFFIFLGHPIGELSRWPGAAGKRVAMGKQGWAFPDGHRG